VWLFLHSGKRGVGNKSKEAFSAGVAGLPVTAAARLVRLLAPGADETAASNQFARYRAHLPYRLFMPGFPAGYLLNHAEGELRRGNTGIRSQI
jgi:hypothetical protein